MTARRLEAALPWIASIIGPAIVFGPMLARGEALFWGTPMLQFVPWRTLALRFLEAGHLPLWNPLLGAGAPLLANYQSALLYPPNWILAVTGPAWGDGLLMMLHLIWAALGMARLARRLGLGPLAQMIAGLSFGLSSSLVARAGFHTMIAAASWLPWLVNAVEGLVSTAGPGETGRARGKAMIAAGLVLAMQWLAGHAQFSWYSFLLAAAWAAFRGAEAGGWRGVARTGALLGAAVALGLALSAVQLAPTAEYLLQSSREGGLNAEHALTYSLWPWRLLGWALPDLFGNPAAGDYWGYGAYWEDALYIGALPFLLALVGFVRGMIGQGVQRGIRRFLAAVGVISLILALGRNTPLYPFLFRHIPTFDLFQAPARWSLLAVFSASMLAACAAHDWRPLEGRGLYWSRLGTAGAAAFALAAWFLGPRLGGIEPTFIRAFGLAGALCAVAGALALLRRPSSPPWWSLAVGAFVLLDLTFAARGLNPSVALDVLRNHTDLAGDLGDQHRVFMPADLEYHLKFERFFRFDSFQSGLDWTLVRESGLPNTLLLDGISSADNFDPLLTSRYAALREGLEALPRDRQDRLLALLDVGWRAEEAPASPEGVRYVAVPGAARVRIVSEVRWVDGPEAALEAVTAEGFDPEGEVILEGAPRDQSMPRGGAGSAELIPDDDPNRAQVIVETGDGGWLVLSDAYYPGWQAFVDGERAGIHPADSLFRAVWVPAGRHRVEFAYCPATFWIGALVSAVAWAALGALWLRWRRD